MSFIMLLSSAWLTQFISFNKRLKERTRLWSIHIIIHITEILPQMLKRPKFKSYIFLNFGSPQLVAGIRLLYTFCKTNLNLESVY